MPCRPHDISGKRRLELASPDYLPMIYMDGNPFSISYTYSIRIQKRPIKTELDREPIGQIMFSQLNSPRRTPALPLIHVVPYPFTSRAAYAFAPKTVLRAPGLGVSGIISSSNQRPSSSPSASYSTRAPNQSRPCGKTRPTAR